MIEEFALFIISCQKNQPIVSLLIESIHQQFRDEVQIFVSTDGEMLDISQKNVTLLVSENQSFGARVQEALAQVPYEQIIVMCDDFIVEEPVKEEELGKVSQFLTKHPTVASIALAQISGKNTSDYRLQHYVKRSEFGKYKTTLQCAFWRKNEFTRLMDGMMSPWEFELFANLQTYHSGYEYYALVSDTDMPIRYNRGKFVIRGHVVLPEKERIETVIGHPIELSDFPVTDSFEQGRDLSMWKRLKRRIRLVLLECYYRYLK